MNRYTAEQYEKDVAFIEKTDHFLTEKKIYWAYFTPLFGCLITHIMYFLMFFKTGIDEMAIFNIFSIIFYIVTVSVFKYVKEKLYIIYAAIAEVIIHASLATIFVGLVADFGMFLLMLVTMIFLMPDRKISFLVLGICVLLYGTLKLFYLNPEYAVYDIGISLSKKFYIINIFIGSSVLVYVSVIYTMMNNYKECKLRVQNEQLRIMASTDPLTKLSNRRAMQKNLAEICKKSKTTGNKYVIAIGDIDNFKKVNDTYGHDFGDSVLSTVASVINENVPENGFTARWGGEEFLFVIPDADVKEGFSYAEKIIQMIRQQTFSNGKTTFSVTMTFGVCEGLPDDNIDNVISTADKRLYKGKMSGKNHAEYAD